MTSRPKITSRGTSLAHAFVHAIIPREVDEVEQSRLYAVAGIDPTACAYCGSPATDADHFRGLVKGGKPSGHFHTPDNLIPSCGPCNQSKGAQHWRKWMLGAAKGSPTTRNVADLEGKVAKLQAFEDASKRVSSTEAEIRHVIGPDLWDAYWQRLDTIKKALVEAEQAADEIRNRWDKVIQAKPTIS